MPIAIKNVSGDVFVEYRRESGEGVRTRDQGSLQRSDVGNRAITFIFEKCRRRISIGYQKRIYRSS